MVSAVIAFGLILLGAFLARDERTPDQRDIDELARHNDSRLPRCIP